MNIPDMTVYPLEKFTMFDGELLPGWTLQMVPLEPFGDARELRLFDPEKHQRATYILHVMLDDPRPHVAALIQLFVPSPVKHARMPDYEI